MKTQIDIKSVLCGMAIGILAFFAIGAATSATNPVGKYQTQICTGGAIILDTQTGEAWSFDLLHNNLGNKQSGFFEPK